MFCFGTDVYSIFFSVLHFELAGLWTLRYRSATAETKEEKSILGLCEIRWKNSGETTIEEGHKVFFGGKKG